MPHQCLAKQVEQMPSPFLLNDWQRATDAFVLGELARPLLESVGL